VVSEIEIDVFFNKQQRGWVPREFGRESELFPSLNKTLLR